MIHYFPDEIWQLIGSYLLCEVEQAGDSVELVLIGTHWTVVFDGEGEYYILPGWQILW